MLQKFAAKKLYESMDSIKKDIKLILNSSEFYKTIRYSFKETILEYLKFFEKNKHINFIKL